MAFHRMGSILHTNNHRVTIAVYSIEKEDGSFNAAVFSQKENIKAIQEGLAKAAKKRGEFPPELVISVHLIPNWERAGNSYQDSRYQLLKNVFIEQAQKALGFLVRVESFYDEAQLTQSEKTFMEHLEAKGANLDIQKFRAVINNKDRRHLQLDSNTIVYDYDVLYQETFGREQQKDAFTAAFFASYYISFNSKIIYTTPESPNPFPEKLEQEYLKFFQEHTANDTIKSAQTNSIYDEPYLRAAVLLRYAKHATVTRPDQSIKDFSPATMAGDECRL